MTYSGFSVVQGLLTGNCLQCLHCRESRRNSWRRSARTWARSASGRERRWVSKSFLLHNHMLHSVTDSHHVSQTAIESVETASVIVIESMITVHIMFCPSFSSLHSSLPHPSSPSLPPPPCSSLLPLTEAHVEWCGKFTA